MSSTISSLNSPEALKVLSMGWEALDYCGKDASRLNGSLAALSLS
jgi:hypothetical protein